MRKEKDRLSRTKWNNLLENLAIVILAFYPLRHIQLGLDFWDTGYNYANFQYMGTKHMDSMWLFSTYLTNAVGNMLTKLQGGDTLMGMNLYTGLFAGALALIGYFFCTRKLKMPKAIVFLGEMTALSLCWCPTASFYNYLTYLFFLLSSILLYLGLTKEEGSRGQKGYLVAAGAFLGANVLVRFSNLPEMGMIVAVWVYDIILWLEERKRGTERTSAGEGFWRRTVRHTLWCLLGYAAAFLAILSDIHLRYGLGEYVAGIRRLFAMTDNAADYKPTAMIMGILGAYVENLYWVARIGGILIGGMALFAVAGWLETLLLRLEEQKGAKTPPSTVARAIPAAARILWAAICGAALWLLYRKGLFSFLFPGYDSVRHPGLVFLALAALSGALAVNVRTLHMGVRVLWAAVCGSMVWWLYQGGFFSFLFYSYDPIWHPGPLFLMLTMLIAAIRIFHRDSPKEEKLISGMIILIIMLTPIGSNNGVLPSLNNLFLAAPYTLWESWRFLRHVGEKRLKRGLAISAFPAKGVLVSFLVLCLFQFGVFGAVFAFAEATGIQDAEATVDNNAVLRNIKMSPQKAEWMTQLSAYVNENGLEGQEVILYGGIPALSYYLQMPSAFNPWSDLASYSYETMEWDMAQLKAMITEKGQEKPVIILEDAYASLFPLSEEEYQKVGEDPKWALLREFMKEFRYEQTFRNVKFAVYL